MDVIGIGTDIVDCPRVARSIDEHGETFLRRVFTSREIAYCSRYRESVERFAGRWAAKEAVLKVLGTGWSGGIGWQQIEITNLASGQPVVALAGAAREHAQRLGIEEILVSLSHCPSHAVAFAIGSGAGGSCRIRDIEPTPEDGERGVP